MSTLVQILCVAIGGALGCISRYGLTLAANWLPGGSTALGTTFANLIGCAGIGVLMTLSQQRDFLHDHAELALRVGFLGGLTTFSTFALESVAMAGQSRWGGWSIHLAANLLLGLLAVIAGAACARQWGAG